MDFLIDLVLHIDQKLIYLVTNYGTLTYAILFLIIFIETGLIVMPFLPGDSLLFAVGTVAAIPGSPLHIAFIIPLLICAALLGDNVNYFVGRFAGKYIKSKKRILFLKKEYIEQTEHFYERYGVKTIIIARFVPIVRTFAPFVAGAGNMFYGKYITFCILGAALWVGSLTTLGYLFGNIPIVKENFEIVILGFIVLSMTPMIVGFISRKRKH